MTNLPIPLSELKQAAYPMAASEVELPDFTLEMVDFNFVEGCRHFGVPIKKWDEGSVPPEVVSQLSEKELTHEQVIVHDGVEYTVAAIELRIKGAWPEGERARLEAVISPPELHKGRTIPKEFDINWLCLAPLDAIDMKA